MANLLLWQPAVNLRDLFMSMELSHTFENVHPKSVDGAWFGC